jgi:hypothetical protein
VYRPRQPRGAVAGAHRLGLGLDLRAQRRDLGGRRRQRLGAGQRQGAGEGREVGAVLGEGAHGDLAHLADGVGAEQVRAAVHGVQGLARRRLTGVPPRDARVGLLEAAEDLVGAGAMSGERAGCGHGG